MTRKKQEQGGLDGGGGLTRRERQIMEIVYRLGEATVAQVREAMEDPPGYSAVRAMIGLLETRGRLQHREEGRKYIYAPTVKREKARRSALRNLLNTFFDGSVEQAVASLLEDKERKLDRDDLERIAAMVDEARRQGR
jgi:predicted transcriptional regulator